MRRKSAHRLRRFHQEADGTTSPRSRYQNQNPSDGRTTLALNAPDTTTDTSRDTQRAPWRRMIDNITLPHPARYGSLENDLAQFSLFRTTTPPTPNNGCNTHTLRRSPIRASIHPPKPRWRQDVKYAPRSAPATVFGIEINASYTPSSTPISASRHAETDLQEYFRSSGERTARANTAILNSHLETIIESISSSSSTSSSPASLCSSNIEANLVPAVVQTPVRTVHFAPAPSVHRSEILIQGRRQGKSGFAFLRRKGTRGEGKACVLNQDRDVGFWGKGWRWFGGGMD